MTSFSALLARLVRSTPSPAIPAANPAASCFGPQDRVLLRGIADNQRIIMSALDDLKTADAKLGASVAAAIATLNADTTKLADLATKLASQVATDDSAELTSLAADISAKAAALDAAVNPPATGDTKTEAPAAA